ncbi:MAG: HAMP domain-containing histidine kinase [Actinobacteria bacterium]|nr:HAMP domain-containing histidine kinase [Actinomycetota bacterium]
MGRVSLRARLTVWYSAIVVVVVIAGVAATLFFMRSGLLQPIDREIAFQVGVFAQEAGKAQSEHELRQISHTYLAAPASEELHNLGFTLLLWTDGGIVSNATTQIETFSAAQRVFLGGPGFSSPETITSPTGEHYRAAIVPVLQGDARLGVVVVAAPLEQLNGALRQLAVLLAGLGLFALAGSGIGIWFLLGRALRPVEVISETAALFSREEPSRRIAYTGPPDEIGHLVTTLNAMLDRVERSFRDQQQFLYDASHELRTPLSIVKGHLEVLDSMGEVTTDMCRDAHKVVAEEIDRMNRVVSELLTLAKSGDRGFLVKDAVRLDEFLEQLFANAIYLGDRDWQLGEVPSITVQADADRLTQMLLNLLRNAVEHTQPGQRIALGGAVRDRFVAIYVRDEGEGIAPADHERIFTRFFTRKGRGKGCYGLGLSIVDALAKAHGGWVEVSSQLAEGSTFTIVLPPD